jgi:transposase
MAKRKRASPGDKKKHKPYRRLEELIRTIAFPKYLGLDEVFLGGVQDKPRQGRKYRCTLAGLRPRRFVALLPTRRIAYLQRILSSFSSEARNAVIVVVIDMWKPFRLLAQRIFPLALVVVDRYHIVKEANKCLDAVRIAIQRTIVSEALFEASKKCIEDKCALDRIRSEAKKRVGYT